MYTVGEHLVNNWYTCREKGRELGEMKVNFNSFHPRSGNKVALIVK